MKSRSAIFSQNQITSDPADERSVIRIGVASWVLLNAVLMLLARSKLVATVRVDGGSYPREQPNQIDYVNCHRDSPVTSRSAQRDCRAHRAGRAARRARDSLHRSDRYNAASCARRARANRVINACCPKSSRVTKWPMILQRGGMTQRLLVAPRAPVRSRAATRATRAAARALAGIPTSSCHEPE
jgi:hypothetical protein